ncbi:hypothetical protein [Streptomyces sp. NPDC088762]|uniref:hypothetical protein n=1 Tax=Streptomyces sp. NPDC088762 TaxID=3365891 RepID=UPI0038165EF3
MASPTSEPLSTMVQHFAERYPAVSLSLRVALTREDVVETVRTGGGELALLTTSSAAEPGRRPAPRRRGQARQTTPMGGPLGARCERSSSKDIG